jgi:hypothetical protein
MGARIYPTENNIGIADGLEARIIREAMDAEFKVGLSSGLTAKKLSGFALSIVTGQLSVDVAAGKAIINGRFVEQTTTVRVTGLTPSVTTNYIFVSYPTDVNGLATTAPVFTVQGTVTPPTNGLLLGRCTTNGTEVTTTYSTITWSLPIVGNYTGNGSGSREIFLGFRPKAIIIYGSAGIPPGVIAFKVDVDSYGISIPYTTSLDYPFLDTSVNRVPGITDVGFTVGYTGSPDPNYTLNRNTIVYRYMVLA